MSDRDKAVEDAGELREVLADVILRDLIDERRSARRWVYAKRSFWVLLTAAFSILYLGVMAKRTGYEALPTQDTVAVIPIEGPIMQVGKASADAIVPQIERVMSADNVRGLVLQIRSGGGIPGESERIISAIERMKTRYPDKPIIAACDVVCASAAYMIAIHADKVYAGRYTMVGSIGAIIQMWDFHEIAERYGVSERTFASGPLKELASSYKPLTGPQEAKLNELVNGAASVFIDEVKTKRGAKLDSKHDLFTGEVWNAKLALQYGLIDELDTLENIAEKHFPDIAMRRFEPIQKGGPGLFDVFFGMSPEDMLVRVMSQMPTIR